MQKNLELGLTSRSTRMETKTMERLHSVWNSIMKLDGHAISDLVTYNVPSSHYKVSHLSWCDREQIISCVDFNDKTSLIY